MPYSTYDPKLIARVEKMVKEGVSHKEIIEKTGISRGYLCYNFDPKYRKVHTLATETWRNRNTERYLQKMKENKLRVKKEKLEIINKLKNRE